MRAPTGNMTWQELLPLFDRALQLDLGQRQSWLDELAATNAELADAVRQLLAERDALDARGFLEHSPLRPSTAKAAGTTVGAYTLERLLGRGGMGEVWLAARSDGAFQGQCAIKFVDAAVMSPSLLERFRRETEVLARLTHPNVARLIDAGTTGDGRAYLAIEYVDGERIDRYCEGSSIDTRVRLILHVIEAVAHAHSQLVIHRDLKPANVLVTRDGHVKLLDFGIAKALRPQDASAEPGVTRMEDAVFTPEFAAPEQILGEMPSTATDVYQLGMLLFVLLTGRLPQRQASTREERIRAALDETLPVASAVADRDMARHLRGDLDAIIATALRRKPADRYQTARELQAELQRYLDHKPVLARRGAALYVARKFIARHRVPVMVSGLAAMGLIGAMLFALRQSQAAAVEARRSQAINAFILSLFNDARPGAGGASDLRVVDLLRASTERIERELADDPVRQVELFSTVGNALVGLNAHDQGLDVFDRGLRVVAREHMEDSVAASAIELGRADALVSLGKTGEAEEILDRVEGKLSRKPPSMLLAKAWTVRSFLLLNQGSDEDAVKYASQAMALTGRLQGTDHIEYFNAVVDLVRAQYHADQCQQAMPHIDTALQRMPHALGSATHTLVTLVRSLRARCLNDLGRYDESIAEFERNDSRVRAIFGPMSKDYAVELHEHAAAERNRGAYDAAIALNRQSIRIMQGAGVQGRNLITLQNAMTLSLVLSRSLGQAETEALKLREMSTAEYGADDRYVARSRIYLALIGGLRGDTLRAIAQLREIADLTRPDDSYNLPARTQVLVGWLLLLHGDPRDADKELTAAVDVLGKREETEGVQLARARGLSGISHLELGDVAEAQALLERAVADYSKLVPLPTPDLADLWIGSARLYLRKRESAKALQFARQADAFWTQQAPDGRWAGEAAYWLGESLRAGGKIREADAALARARRILRSSPFPRDARLFSDAVAAR